MVVSRTWCMLKWKRTVYDLKISILSMSVAKLLSDVNSVFTNDFLLDKQRFRVDKCILLARLNEMHFHSTTLSNRNNYPLMQNVIFPLALCRKTAHIPQRRTFYEVFYIYDIAF